MEIINIVEIKRGILTNIQSFPIIVDDNKQIIVEMAEKLFLEKARENGCEVTEWDDESLLDNGDWDNENGYEVMIVWSHQIHEIRPTALDTFIESVDLPQN